MIKIYSTVLRSANQKQDQAVPAVFQVGRAEFFG